MVEVAPPFCTTVLINNVGYATLNERLIGVDLSSNTDVVGRRHPEGRTDSSKFVTDGTVVVAQYRSHLIAFQAADGKELWRTPSVQFQYGDSRLVISPSFVYAISQKGMYSIQILVKSSGREVYRFEAPSWKERLQSPSIIGGRLFVLEANKIYCLEGS